MNMDMTTAQGFSQPLSSLCTCGKPLVVTLDIWFGTCLTCRDAARASRPAKLSWYEINTGSLTRAFAFTSATGKGQALIDEAGNVAVVDGQLTVTEISQFTSEVAEQDASIEAIALEWRAEQLRRDEEQAGHDQDEAQPYEAIEDQIEPSFARAGGGW